MAEDFDPTSIGAVAVADYVDSSTDRTRNAVDSDFDPASIGAVPVDDEFDPRSLGAVEVEEPKGVSAGDLIRRIPAGISEAGAQSVAGGLKFAEDLGSALRLAPLPVQQGLSAIETISSSMPGEGTGLSKAVSFMKDVAERSKSEYGVDPDRDDNFLSQLFSGAGSLVPAIASGPLAPATMGAMMGESGRSEAEAAGADEKTQKLAFYANAAVGALSEALLGAPALLRSVKASKIPDAVFKQMVKAASIEAFKGSLREGAQEGIEQLASNTIAKYIAGYDKNRGVWSGVGTAAAAGAILGLPMGGLLKVAHDFSTEKPSVVQQTIDELVTPEIGKSPEEMVIESAAPPTAPTVPVPEPEVITSEPEISATPEPDKVTLSPHTPTQKGEHIVSTGIMTPEGIATGEGWNTKHADIIKNSETIKLALAEGMEIEQLDANKGFIIQDADGNQKFVGRKRAVEIGKKSGQVDESILYTPDELL